MSADLPLPRTREQTFMAAMVRRLERQNDLLEEIRDLLADRDRGGEPMPDGEGEGGAVRLVEPAALPDAEPQTLVLTEPDQPPVEPEPAKRTRRTPTKTAAAPRRRTPKGQN